MVYASLQEAWGIEAFTAAASAASAQENPYVVQDAAQNQANYGSFQQKNQFKSVGATTALGPTGLSKPRYFVPREDDEYSQVSIVEQQPFIPHHAAKPPKSNNGNSKIECVSMITHLQSCKLCSSELSEHLRNVFLKEFILFAGSGIMMFLFLDLLRKIAQKA
jgi:hypothetical protein